jgi:hypothetical protein
VDHIKRSVDDLHVIPNTAQPWRHLLLSPRGKQIPHPDEAGVQDGTENEAGIRDDRKERG